MAGYLNCYLKLAKYGEDIWIGLENVKLLDQACSKF
jgi:hypothetical protein